MNEYFKRDSARRRDTKWFLCPLYKAVSHAAASPTRVSHKSKAASLCWEGESSTGKVLCVCIYVFSRERKSERAMPEGGSWQTERVWDGKQSYRLWEKRAKETVWAVSKTGSVVWTRRLSHLCADKCRATIRWLPSRCTVWYEIKVWTMLHCLRRLRQKVTLA